MIKSFKVDDKLDSLFKKDAKKLGMSQTALLNYILRGIYDPTAPNFMTVTREVKK